MHTGEAASGIHRLQPATICSQPASMRFHVRSARCAAPTHLCCIRVIHPLALPVAQRLIVGQTPSHSAAQEQAKHIALLDQQAWQQVRPGLMRAFCRKPNGKAWAPDNQASRASNHPLYLRRRGTRPSSVRSGAMASSSQSARPVQNTGTMAPSSCSRRKTSEWERMNTTQTQVRVGGAGIRAASRIAWSVSALVGPKGRRAGWRSIPFQHKQWLWLSPQSTGSA